MTNLEQLEILKQGAVAWNKWRDINKEISPDLGKANLSETDLREVNFCKADLREANLSKANLRKVWLCGANLYKANLRGADLRGSDFSWANLAEADFQDSDLSKAVLAKTNLFSTNFSCAKLNGAYLNEANLVKTHLEGTDISNCRIYGISAWDLKISDETKQFNLVITPPLEPIITVDNLEVAQFIYLLLKRENLRNVLSTITSKCVLILGRFTPERKFVLDSIANELRKNDLLPIIFDFERSTNRDFTETIKILSGMSLFVIADITNPKSAPLELQAAVPDYQIPFVPIIEKGAKPFSMFSDLPKYNWVLMPVIEYPSLYILLKNFKKAIIDRAWIKHKELQKVKVKKVEVLSIEGFTASY